MKLDVEEVIHYRIKCYGDDLGTFQIVSRWEGMLKLASSSGEVIIVDDGKVPNIFDAFHEMLASNPDGEKHCWTLMKASPEVLNRAKRKPGAATSSRTSDATGETK